MKIIKRIIEVFLLILVCVVIGYLVFTSSRLASQQDGKTATMEVVYVQEKNF